jgi:mannitol/fructose-specific phosphotransferase system IIA component
MARIRFAPPIVGGSGSGITQGDLDAALAAHTVAADPHAPYQKESEKTALSGYAALDGSGLVPLAELPGTLDPAAVTNHEAAADPHAGYQKESEKGTASGYAGLDSGGTVPDNQLPAAIARDTEVTSSIGTHTALPNAHHAETHAINGGGHTGVLDDGQIPSGVARDAEVTSAIGTHAGLADPHAGYVLESLGTGKGVLISFTGANTPVGVSPGSNYQQLIADSAQSAGLRFKSGSAIDAEDFGAVGDNSTANDTAVAAALATMTSTGPRKLRFGPGTFRFSSDLVLPNLLGITLEGHGRTSTILSFATGKGIKTDQTALVEYARIADLWVAMIGTPGTGIGIDFSGFARSVIERVRATLFTSGIKCSDATNQFDSHHNIIYDPIMSSCTNGIELTGSPTHSAYDGEIFGGDISQCTVGILVSGASINGWQAHGTSLESNTTALDIHGNRNYFHPRFEGNTTDVNFRSDSFGNKVRTAFVDTAKITDSTSASNNGTNEIEVDGFGDNAHTAHPKEFLQTFDAFSVPSTGGGGAGDLVCEAANQGYFVRVLPQRYHKITSLQIVPITSVGNVDAGILEAYTSSTEAGTLLASSGSVAMTGTGNSTQTLTLSSTVYMVPGREYFFVVAFDTINAVIYGSTLDLVNLAAKRATIVEGHQRSDTKASMFPLSGKTFTSLGFTSRIPWIAGKT